MESPTPPTPRAMPDNQLNAEVARLQSQPDGLMAAMALIEQQNALRQQDSFEFSQWQLQVQMNAAIAPRVAYEPEPLPQVSPAQAEAPEVIVSQPIQVADNVDDIVAALNRNYAAAASDPQPETVVEPEPENIEPEPSVQPAVVEPAPVSSISSGDASQENTSEPATELEAEEVTVSRTKTGAALSWSWISVAASPLVLVLAAFLKESGASLAQSIIVLAGLIVTTAVLAGVGSVAAKRGSSAIGVVSRAAFGVWGNIFPALILLLVKIVWSLALVILSARILAPLIFNQPWFGAISSQFVFPAEFTALMITTIPMIVIASLIAGFGGITMLRAQQLAAVFSLLGSAGIGFHVFTGNSILDLRQGEMLSSASLLDLAILGFAVFGFAVFSQSGDFARKLPVDTPGAKVFFLSFVSTLFIPLAVGIMGVLWIFMAEESFGLLLTDQLIPTVAQATPIWVFIVFVVAVGLSVLQLLANSIYSLVGALESVGSKVPGAVSVLLVAIILLAGTLSPSLLIPTSLLLELVVELLTLVAVPAAAFTGILLADALIRSRDYHEVSLTRDYGYYGRFNFANVTAFVLASALGFGYLNGTGALSFWSGYLGDFTPQIFELAGSNIGIAMAFGLAILSPVVFGIPRIKSQEVKLVELDERREELKEYLDTAK